MRPVTSSTSKLTYLLAAVGVILLPVFVAMLLLAAQGFTLADYAPSFSDAVYHWHQPASFARVGLATGYYTADEAIPAATFSHYYAWGMAAPVLYGVLAWLFGWTYASGVLFNWLALMLAIALYIRLTRATLPQLGMLAVVLALYPPLMLFAPLHMLETPYMALALVLAGGFYRLVSRTATRRSLIVLALALILACWMRPTWGIFWLPFCAYGLPRRPLTALLLSIGLSGIGFYVYQVTGAPYPYFFGNVIAETRTAIASVGLVAGLQHGMMLWSSLINTNLTRFLMGYPYELLMRGQVIGLALALQLRLWRRIPVYERGEMRLHLLNLGAALAFVLLVYNTGDFIDFRFLAGILLFSLALLIARRRWRWLAPFVLTFVLVLPSVLTSYQQWAAESYQWAGRPQVAVWSERWANAGISYDADAPSAWCNSVTVSYEYVFRSDILLGFEPGMGLSFLNYWDYYTPRAPLKARYLVLNAADAAAYPQPEQISPLGTFDGVHLFLNRAQDCGAR